MSTHAETVIASREALSASNGRDRSFAVVLMRAARSEQERADTMRLLAQKRKVWLDYLTVTQRKWQSKTRNPNSDSIEIREYYVRSIR